MKKWICYTLCLLILFVMTGCGTSSGASVKKGNQTSGVADVLESGMAEADSQNATESQTEPEPEPAPEAEAASDVTYTEDDIDVDLTVLSSTMVYSEVYNMMVSPQDYIGKTVKMKGLFTYFHNVAEDYYYFACIIQDATACCAQGIEFELTDDYVFPDDYPELEEEVCVVGVFDTYQEGEYMYCTLRNARLC